MTKRLNPFEDEAPFQSKTHVRQKEVDLGVQKEENMKVIYDKTLKLLFQGATQVSKALTNGHDEKCAFSNHGGHNGSSYHKAVAGTSFQNGFKENTLQPGPKLKPCCQRNRQSKCNFCETCICGECLCVCHRCYGEFCNLCSVMRSMCKRWPQPVSLFTRYQMAEAAVCLSCYP